MSLKYVDKNKQDVEREEYEHKAYDKLFLRCVIDGQNNTILLPDDVSAEELKLIKKAGHFSHITGNLYRILPVDV